MNRAAQLSTFADNDPANPILLCDLLDELLSSGQIEEARSRLNKAADELRELPGVRYRNARCALLAGDTKTTVNILQSLRSSMTEVPVGVVHDLAYAQFVDGQWQEAMLTLAQSSYQGEDAAILALLKARILHHQQQCEAALEVLATHDSGSYAAEVRGMRSLLWLDLNNLEHAIAEAEQALRLDPDQHHANLVLGAAALCSQKADDAITVFKRVLAKHSDSGRAWLGLGHASMLRGEVKVSRSEIERASVHMPEHIGTWHTLAWCQLMDDDLAAAERSFERAFALDRTFGETHGGLAVIHAIRGKRKEAEDSIKRAVRLDPQGRSGRYAQSLLLFAEGRVDEARKIVQELLMRAPNKGVSLTADYIFSSCVGLQISGGRDG
jgi:tetratricopeptide (TPR) repeat protein